METLDPSELNENVCYTRININENHGVFYSCIQMLLILSEQIFLHIERTRRYRTLLTIIS
jgi:hypothetical protein